MRQLELARDRGALQGIERLLHPAVRPLGFLGDGDLLCVCDDRVGRVAGVEIKKPRTVDFFAAASGGGTAAAKMAATDVI